VKIYEKQVEEKYRVGVSMKKIHTLEDVMREIDEAQKNYDENDRIGVFAPVRKAFRKLGANIEACKLLWEFHTSSSFESRLKLKCFVSKFFVLGQ
jgi:hypothetical protein